MRFFILFFITQRKRLILLKFRKRREKSQIIYRPEFENNNFQFLRNENEAVSPKSVGFESESGFDHNINLRYNLISPGFFKNFPKNSSPEKY
jgi:hypothetical protein